MMRKKSIKYLDRWHQGAEVKEELGLEVSEAVAEPLIIIEREEILIITSLVAKQLSLHQYPQLRQKTPTNRSTRKPKTSMF